MRSVDQRNSATTIASRCVAGGARHDLSRSSKVVRGAPRTVEYWVRGFEDEGLAGLREGERSGRPLRLSRKQLQLVSAALRQMPRALGLGRQSLGRQNPGRLDRAAVWDQLGSATMSALAPAVGFRLRKPRPATVSGGSVNPQASEGCGSQEGLLGLAY